MKKHIPHKRSLKIRVFTSLEEENQFEILRMQTMTPSQRLDEVAILQKRTWGDKWTKTPIKKIISYEKVSW